MKSPMERTGGNFLQAISVGNPGTTAMPGNRGLEPVKKNAIVELLLRGEKPEKLLIATSAQLPQPGSSRSSSNDRI